MVTGADPESGYDDTQSHTHHRTRTPRATHRRARPAITTIRITRIETVPMTPVEYDTAVEALAVLIARYERTHPDP